MSYTLLFDRKQRVVLVRFGNLLTEPALVAMRKAVGAFIAKEGSCRAIVDLSAVEKSDVRASFIADIARSGPIINDHKRALVAPKPEVFGLSRMYELNQDSTEGNTIVARTLEAACEALGAHALTLEELAP